MRRLFLAVNRLIYARLARHIIFRSSAQDAHIRIVNVLARFDGSSLLCKMLTQVHYWSFAKCQITIGGVELEHPFILAAGMVKGQGFDVEADAIAAAERGENIIPGWKSVPRLVGQVEFGSYTRHPRLGNPGLVIWRDAVSRSTQNRVGLKNPGAKAAAVFLKKHHTDLPAIFGINIAPTPGLIDAEKSSLEIIEAVDAFLNACIHPSWFTLNLSCPNTEDDPSGNQTEAEARHLCGALVDHLQEKGIDIPVWVKISPGLADEQYRILLRVFQDVGVKAIIATNTLAQPVPNEPTLMGGVGGGKLQGEALRAVEILTAEKVRHGYTVDIIGCGGVLNGATYRDFQRNHVQVVQYWSALVYRGPLAAALIQDEAQHV